MGHLGRQLRTCPARRPGVVAATVALVLGVLLAAVLVGVVTNSAATGVQDVAFLAVVVAICLATGLALLASRRRRLRAALTYRVFEAGVVRETTSGRHVLPFTDLAALRVQRTSLDGGDPFLTVVLSARDGTEVRIDEPSVDNVDDSLVALLERCSGRRAEPLTRRR